MPQEGDCRYTDDSLGGIDLDAVGSKSIEDLLNVLALSSRQVRQ